MISGRSYIAIIIRYLVPVEFSGTSEKKSTHRSIWLRAASVTSQKRGRRHFVCLGKLDACLRLYKKQCRHFKQGQVLNGLITSSSIFMYVNSAGSIYSTLHLEA